MILKKGVAILGSVVGLILASGLMFWLGSSDKPGPVARATETSEVEEMLQMAVFEKNHGEYDQSYLLFRQLLELDLPDEVKRDTVYQLGILFADEGFGQGKGGLENAMLYLQSAYEASEDDPPFHVRVGLKMLEVAERLDDRDRVRSLTEQLLALELEGDSLQYLWGQYFDALFDCERPWSELQSAMLKAEGLQVFDAEWLALLDDVRLRIKEKLLTDSAWFSDYSNALGVASSEQRKKLSVEVYAGLQERLDAADSKGRSLFALRMGKVMAACGDREGAVLKLRYSLEADASSDPVKVLELVVALYGKGDNDVELRMIAQQMGQGQNLSEMSLDEKLRMVELLSRLQCYETALVVISSDLEGSVPGVGSDELFSSAVHLAYWMGDDARACKYMDWLVGSGGGRKFDQTLQEIMDLQFSRNEYQQVYDWGLRYLPSVSVGSPYIQDILFNIFDAIYWLDNSTLEKIYVGSAAIQAGMEDKRASAAILRLAECIEDMGLYHLAETYYNRIGLLNFFHDEEKKEEESLIDQSIGEQAMLGKGRCLKKNGDWVKSDRLFRELAHRTSSPMVRSEVALNWAEIALHFDQWVEADRRYGLVDHLQLPQALQSRYQLGQSRLHRDELLSGQLLFEDTLALLDGLPDGERRQATVEYFNETFELLWEQKDKGRINDLITLAGQSEFSDFIPIQSYILRLSFLDADVDKIAEISRGLRNATLPEEASMLDLAMAVRQVEQLNTRINEYSNEKSK